MLNFLNQFLDFVRLKVIEDDPHQVYKFHREDNSGYITCTHYTQSSEWNFIPNWYIEKFK